MNNLKHLSLFKRSLIVLSLLIFIAFIVVISSSSDNKENTQVVSKNEPIREPAMSKEQAQKELEQLMQQAVQAQLISSYDFKEIGENVYRWDIFVGKNWYMQTVQQKKVFIAFIAIRKKAITGYSNFKLNDAYTNEKVAEVTSFSSSIEIYK